MGWRCLLRPLIRRTPSKLTSITPNKTTATTNNNAAQCWPISLHHHTSLLPPSSDSSSCAPGRSTFHKICGVGGASDGFTLKYGHLLQGLQKISTFNPSLQSASDGSEQPVRSPLSQAPGPLGSAAGTATQRTKSKVVRAILKKINQSPKKVGLVAKLVRGMRADDALMQMAVLPKRAAKTVYKVIHSARANAIHNNGLESARLVVAEAFVGKGVYLKRPWIHGKGKQGIRTRRTCRLTVVLKEMSPVEEAEVAKKRVMRFQKQRMHRSQFPKAKLLKLSPHRLLETKWNRERNIKSKNRCLSSSS